MCFETKREIFASKTHFLGSADPAMLFLGLPETTVFVVVSCAHTGVSLAHVPETTIKIVVSGHMR